MERAFIRLQALNPDLAGRYWRFRRSLLLGRAEGLDLVLQDESVSRFHAEIMRTPDGWIIRDLDSTNGTFVNEKRIGEVGMMLDLGDSLQLGLTRFLVVDMRPYLGVLTSHRPHLSDHALSTPESCDAEPRLAPDVREHSQPRVHSWHLHHRVEGEGSPANTRR